MDVKTEDSGTSLDDRLAAERPPEPYAQDGYIPGLKSTHLVDLKCAIDELRKAPDEVKQHLSDELTENVDRCVEWAEQFKTEHPNDPLTVQQAASIHLYTMELETNAQRKNTSMFAVLNKFMAEPTRPRLKPFYPYLKLLCSGLLLLPRVQRKLYRGVRMAGRALNKYTDGKAFHWWSFTSCSTDRSVIPWFSGDNGTVFTIEALNAVDISRYSHSPAEKEHILLPATRFKVATPPYGDEALTRVAIKETKPSFVWSWCTEQHQENLQHASTGLELKEVQQLLEEKMDGSKFVITEFTLEDLGGDGLPRLLPLLHALPDTVTHVQLGSWHSDPLLAQVRAHVSDTHIKALQRLRLQHLDLYGCKKITDAGLQALAAGNPALTFLRLQGCTEVTDQGVMPIVRGCPALAHVSLINCAHITDASVKELCHESKGVSILELYGCVKITDASLVALSSVCAQLKHLDLYGCKKITDAGLQALAAGNPALTFLRLQGCTEVTDASRHAIQASCPQLLLVAS